MVNENIHNLSFSSNRYCGKWLLTATIVAKTLIAPCATMTYGMESSGTLACLNMKTEYDIAWNVTYTGSEVDDKIIKNTSNEYLLEICLSVMIPKESKKTGRLILSAYIFKNHAKNIALNLPRNWLSKKWFRVENDKLTDKYMQLNSLRKNRFNLCLCCTLMYSYVLCM